MARSAVQAGRFGDAGFLILASLAAGDKHGYAIAADIAAFSGTRFEPGTLYNALSRLEGAGLIEAREADERRRPYRLTAAGREELASSLVTLERVVRTSRSRVDRFSPTHGAG
jgi:DNA-binding PadR family transcriptional regulator